MKFFSALLFLPASVSCLTAAAPQESDYYRITTFETPKETALEVGSIDLMPDGKLALGTRRGEIWIVSGAGGRDPSAVSYQLFASGQHEVLGIAWNPKDGWLYATTRYEITRVKDVDGDGRADVFETVCDQWGVRGDYHEYAFGSHFDKAGDLWVTLCLTGSFSTARCRFAAGRCGSNRTATMIPDLLRHPQSRRHRLRCRWRGLLHRQPGTVARLLHAPAPGAGQLPGASRRKHLV